MRTARLPIAMATWPAFAVPSIILISLSAAGILFGSEARNDVIERLREVSLACARAQRVDIHRLTEIGKAQCTLRDVEGGLATLSSVPIAEQRRDWWVIGLVERVVAAQVAVGDVKTAFHTISAIPWTRVDRGHCATWLALARAAHVRRNVEAAMEAVRHAAAVAGEMTRDYDRHIYLCDVALAQSDMGDRSGGAETLQRVVAVTETIQEDPAADRQARSRSLCRLADVYARAGHREAAQETFSRAEAAIDVADLGGDLAYHLIATARAKVGDIEGGLRVAKLIPGTWGGRDHAIHDIVLLLLEDGETDEAEQTARLIQPNVPQYYDSAWIEICRTHACGGNMQRALAVAEELGKGSRRAQAVLEVCTMMARSGNTTEARRIAHGLTYPQREPRLSPPDVPPEPTKTFQFCDHRTWGLPYDFVPPITSGLMYLSEQAAGDLTAAAMRCRVALDGEAGISHSEHLDDWDVLKVARAQAVEGDAKGALGWIDGLSNGKRVAALIGVAEGLAEKERREGK